MVEIPSVKDRSEKVSVAPQSRVIEVNSETQKPIIESLINKGYSSHFWGELAALRPEEAERFADDQILRRRKGSVREFEEAMQNLNWDEPAWGKFFDENRWIFGLAVRGASS